MEKELETKVKNLSSEYRKVYDMVNSSSKGTTAKEVADRFGLPYTQACERLKYLRDKEILEDKWDRGKKYFVVLTE